MSETKVFSFGEQAAGNNIAAMLPGLLQNRGIDSGYLMGLLSNCGNNGGLFGNNGGFQDLIALIVFAAIFGNGNFGFGNNGNQNAEAREMIMQTLNRNGLDITTLAQSINTSADKILAGINQVSGAICNLGTQTGQGFNQVLTAMLQGNNALTSQIASCCCDLKTQLAGLGTGMERGFSSVAYETQRQTCDIEKAIATSTEKILEGQRAAEMRDLQDKLDALREKNAQQAVILNNAQQTAQFSAMLAPIAEDLASIKCKLPKTETITVQPDYVPINRSINVAYAPYYGCGYNGFANGYGWNGGCGNNSLWG